MWPFGSETWQSSTLKKIIQRDFERYHQQEYYIVNIHIKYINLVNFVYYYDCILYYYYY